MKIYDTIYLQYDIVDTTWCEDKINDDDVEYTLAKNADALRAENERLRGALESLRRHEHDECEDCWYSCHKHPDCCNDERDDGRCTCGMDQHNEIIDNALRGGDA